MLGMQKDICWGCLSGSILTEAILYFSSYTFALTSEVQSPINAFLQLLLLIDLINFRKGSEINAAVNGKTFMLS